MQPVKLFLACLLLAVTQSGAAQMRAIATLSGLPGDLADSDLYGALIGPDGSIYFSASDLFVVYRMASPSGSPTVFAGTFNRTASGSNGDNIGDGGPATSATLFYPAALAADSAGSVYIVDDCRVRKVNTAGVIMHVAGAGTCNKTAQPYGGDGGLGSQTRLVDPFDVAVDSAGNVYIGDEGGARVIWASTGRINTFFSASYCSIALHPLTGLVYVGTFISNQIWAVNATNQSSTLCYGNGQAAHSADGAVGPNTPLNAPYSLRFEPNSNILLFSEVSSNLVRAIDTSANTMTTIAGTGAQSPVELGPAAPTTIPLHTPWGISPDANGHIVITESDGGQPGPPLHVYYLEQSAAAKQVVSVTLVAMISIASWLARVW